MKKFLTAVICIVAVPALANDCSVIIRGGGPVSVYTSPDPSTVDLLSFKNATSEGHFDGSYESGGRIFSVTDGLVKATGTDTCSVEFTVKTDVLPGLRYIGAARIGAAGYLAAGTYSLPLLRRVPVGLGKGVEAPRTFPFYFRGSTVADRPK